MGEWENWIDGNGWARYGEVTCSNTRNPYLNKGKTMQLVLIRGLPGSGKSTMARALCKAGFEWFEADAYHLNDQGDYCYAPTNVKAAHEWCQRETFKALENGKRVVVSNTFTRRFEMDPYFEMAKTFGIEPNVLEATGNWPNTHGVPAKVVEKMRQRWEKLDG